MSQHQKPIATSDALNCDYSVKGFRDLLDADPDYEEKRAFIDWMHIKTVHNLAATIYRGSMKQETSWVTFGQSHKICSDDPRHWAQHFCRKSNETLIKFMDRV